MQIFLRFFGGNGHKNTASTFTGKCGYYYDQKNVIASNLKVKDAAKVLLFLDMCKYFRIFFLFTTCRLLRDTVPPVPTAPHNESAPETNLRGAYSIPCRQSFSYT